MTAATAWLLGHRPDPQARLRLICLPYAGGSATMFHGWAAELPPAIDVCAVQLPGRHARLAEPPFRELEPLLDACLDALAPLGDLPWALFGHSIGAIIAFEIARRRRDAGRAVRHLFVSAMQAPHLPPRRPMLHALDEPALLRELGRLGGVPPAVLANRELLELALPALRADAAVYERYRFEYRPPLDCPVSVLGGRDDHRPPPSELPAWRAHTRGACSIRTFPGGHFYVDSQRAAVLAAIAEDLRPWTT